MHGFRERLKRSLPELQPPASHAEIQATFEHMQATAQAYREEMLGDQAKFDYTVEVRNRPTGYAGIFRESHEICRTDHPVWMVRGGTDYAERPLVKRFPGLDIDAANGRAWNTTVEMESDTKFAVDVATGAICKVERTRHVTERYRTPVDEMYDRQWGRDDYRQLDDEPVAPDDLFDTSKVTTDGLSDIAAAWETDLLDSAARYARITPIRLEDYYPGPIETSLGYHSNPGL